MSTGSPTLLRVTSAMVGLTILAATAVSAADKVVIGSTGQGAATNWPVYIASKKGFYEAEGLKPDFVYGSSNTTLMQQLSAGSLDVSLGVGLVDPLRAIDKGAPIAIVSVSMQAPPFVLVAKSTIKTIADLKGKTVSVGGAKDITRIFVERMAIPNGIQPSDYNVVFAGSTAARFAALQAGGVDAALVLPPFSFYAESAGFSNLGLTVDYAKDLPFSGTVVNRDWATKNEALVRKIISVESKTAAWFSDPKNRDEAIKIMEEEGKLKSEDVAKAYDFLREHAFFANAGTVSKSKLGVLISVLGQLGEIEGGTDASRFILPNVTKVLD